MLGVSVHSESVENSEGLFEVVLMVSYSSEDHDVRIQVRQALLAMVAVLHRLQELPSAFKSVLVVPILVVLGFEGLGMV